MGRNEDNFQLTSDDPFRWEQNVIDRMNDLFPFPNDLQSRAIL